MTLLSRKWKLCGCFFVPKFAKVGGGGGYEAMNDILSESAV